MLRLRFRQYEEAADSVIETGDNRVLIVGRQIRHRWCFGLAVTASILALLAISLGFSAVGVTVCIAAILPFAFFS
jgi:hypothetical protein